MRLQCHDIIFLMKVNLSFSLAGDSLIADLGISEIRFERGAFYIYVHDDGVRLVTHKNQFNHPIWRICAYKRMKYDGMMLDERTVVFRRRDRIYCAHSHVSTWRIIPEIQLSG